ncbi:MAG: hypothetical protein EHM61_09615 [Acidobacteria bacterium]|nr:MAG: hypothetical protein EHM61_09615 [Acidobacteriota bacterium]
MAFHHFLLSNTQALWDKMLDHEFLRQTATGEIPFDVFANWLRQDYLFVREAIPFIAVVLSRGPDSVRPGLAAAIPALESELELFQRIAGEKGIQLSGEMTPTCHAYVQYMIATAHAGSFEEALTLLYCAEKAYFDCWSFVRRTLTGASPWREFVDRWSNESFAGWIKWLEEEIDKLLQQASETGRQRMAETFRLTTRYEYLFWEMALRGESWPDA